MITRIISSLLGLPIAFFIVLKGGLLLKLGTVFVSFVSLFEFYRAVCKKIIPIHFFGFFISLIYILILKTNFVNYMDIIFLVLFIAMLLSLVFYHSRISCVDISITLFGFFYTTFMFSTVYLTRSLNYGQYTVWLPFISAWLCDTGAYFAGITLGKHKLTPKLSPKKTIEGSIGGLLLATLGSFIYGYFINNKFLQLDDINFTLFSTIAGFLGALFSQFGDLTASSIKRKFNVKDYGNLIPGHGGILDRFDSIIFSGAIIYILAKFLN